MRLLAVKCPECGATLNVEEGRQQYFCSYCGAKVVLENENEYVYRYIDEAEVKQAETDRMLRIRELELEEKARELEQAENQKHSKRAWIFFPSWIAISIILILFWKISEPCAWIGGASAVIWFMAVAVYYSTYLTQKENAANSKMRGKGLIQLNIDGNDWNNFHAMEARIRSLGFTNVQCINLRDMYLNSTQEEYAVVSVLINGEDANVNGNWYQPNDPVVISYHGRAI